MNDAEPRTRNHSDLTPHASGAGPKTWLIAFVAAALLYGLTANRGPQWQDSGVQQLRIISGQIDNPLGLALCHPLQYWLGRAAIKAPGLAPAFAITLISSLAAAIAVANLAATIMLLTRNALATLIPVTALALSHTFWQHATHTESYALVAALLTGEWLCLTAFATSGKTRYLLLTALLNGLGIGTHMMAALALPVDVAVFVWALRAGKCSSRAAVAAALLWLLGTTPYSGLVLLRIFETGDVGAVLYSALFGRFAPEVLNIKVNLRTALLPIGYVAYNFPGLTVPLAVAGIYWAVKTRVTPRWLTRALLAELVIYAAFVFRYSITDQYTFFFPVYLILALFAGLALARIATSAGRRGARIIMVLAALTAVWTPAVYLATAAILRSRGVLKTMVGNKPYRDGYRSFFVPWGVGDDHAQRLNEAVRDLASENGLVLVAYNMIGVGVRYEQAAGRIPPSVTLRCTQNITDDAVAEVRAEMVAAMKAGRPVVLTPKDRDAPGDAPPGYRWRRRGDLYVLEAIAPTAATQPDDDD